MSAEGKSNRAVAQAANVTFELHTLGWEAFQNLCGHIAREILGQSVTVFSPGNDAGQDGAFQGTWQKAKDEVFSGRFVIQCKFTARRDEHLGLGNLKEELVKAERLADCGLAQTYLLMSNAKVSGDAYIAIREAFLKIKGIEYFELHGSEWITRQIIESKRLRAFVPRIYGLGDLSQILDERVYEQTNEILQTWHDNLTKFVPTETHSKSVKALLDEGFVLLLGDPMAGKSTIAAALAIAAADQSKCVPVFATHPDDFKAHWNPNEPNQFFWVDDAFGQTQFDPELAEGWSRLFPHLAAAIRKGTRILFTSRNYIFETAKHALKESSFPLIRKSHVVIEVENLKPQEKERILYNHLRLGGQPVAFRKAIKPFLPAIASHPKFFPEVARRLGDPFFTKSLVFSEAYLKNLIEEPIEFLGEIIDKLDRQNFAALALLFMRAGRASIPLEIGKEEKTAMDQLGAELVQLREALATLSGSLVSVAIESGERLWKFRHPSIRDAMAAHVAARPDLIDVYLRGVKPAELLREVVCGTAEIAGAKVHVPSNRFSAVISKLCGFDVDSWSAIYSLLPFLNHRCTPDFCAIWFAECREAFERLCQNRFIWSYQYCALILRLHRIGCLPEERRQQFVREAVRHAMDSAESMVLCDTELCELFTEEERKSALQQVRGELPAALRAIIDEVAGEYTNIDEEPSEHFERIGTQLEGFREYFDELKDEEMVEAFERGQNLVERAVERLEEWQSERQEEALEEKKEEEELRAGEEEVMGAMIAEYERGGTSGDSQKVTGPSQPRFSTPSPPRSVFDDVDS
jgi:hypothetical protein